MDERITMSPIKKILFVFNVLLGLSTAAYAMDPEASAQKSEGTQSEQIPSAKRKLEALAEPSAHKRNGYVRGVNGQNPVGHHEESEANDVDDSEGLVPDRPESRAGGLIEDSLDIALDDEIEVLTEQIRVLEIQAQLKKEDEELKREEELLKREKQGDQQGEINSIGETKEERRRPEQKKRI